MKRKNTSNIADHSLISTSLGILSACTIFIHILKTRVTMAFGPNNSFYGHLDIQKVGLLIFKLSMNCFSRLKLQMVGSLVCTYQGIFLKRSWWNSAVGGAPPTPKGNSEKILKLWWSYNPTTIYLSFFVIYSRQKTHMFFMYNYLMSDLKSLTSYTEYIPGLVLPGLVHTHPSIFGGKLFI